MKKHVGFCPMMKYVPTMVGLTVMLAQSAFALEVVEGRAVKESGKPGVVSVTTTTETIQVLAVDQAKRTMKLKTSDGQVGTYEVSKEVRNLPQVKKGDVYKANEVERLTIYAKTSKNKPSYVQTFTVARAPKGSKPGFVASQTIRITGRVQLVQPKQRSVVITGPRGKSAPFKVARDVKNLQQLKPGDLVVVNYTDTLTVGLVPPKK